MRPKELSRIEGRQPRSAWTDAAIGWSIAAAVVVVALGVANWWRLARLHTEDRIASALEAQVDMMRQRDAVAPSITSLLPGDAWSVVTIEERGAVAVTITIGGQQHHGRGATRQEAEAAALEAWRGVGGPRAIRWNDPAPGRCRLCQHT